MAIDWLLLGLTLAIELIFASLVAVWTRWVSNAKIPGQTIWNVVIGVGGVVQISAIYIGFAAAGLLTVFFIVASIPMAIEYFGRLHREEREAQAVREELIDEYTGADRQE